MSRLFGRFFLDMKNQITKRRKPIPDLSYDRDSELEKFKNYRQYIFGVPTALFAAYKVGKYAWDNRKDVTWENLKREATFYNVQKYSGMVDQVLVNFPTNDDTTVSAGLKAVSFMHEISEQFGPTLDEIVGKYAKDRGLEPCDSIQLIPLILGTKLADHFTNTEVMRFEDGDKLYCIASKDETNAERIYYVGQIYAGHENMRLQGHVFKTPGFDLSSIQTLFWNLYPEGVYISSGNDDRTKGDGSATDKKAAAVFKFENGLCIYDLPMAKDITYYGRRNKQIEKTYTNLKKYRDKGIQRNFLLVGTPGSGKSSFAILLAKRHTNKVFKISNSVLFDMDKGDLDLIFKLLGPEFIIADDFDRAGYSDAQRVLYFLESMKEDHCNISLIATANDLDSIDVACLRPGRFDEIMSFMPPTETERTEVIKKYADHYKVMLSETELKKLVEISKGYTHAYLKEFVLHIMHDDIDSLIKRIKMLKSLQLNGNFMTFGETDIEDDSAEEATLVPESDDDDDDAMPINFGLASVEKNEDQDDDSPRPAKAARKRRR
jgi:hypothetical protein